MNLVFFSGTSQKLFRGRCPPLRSKNFSVPSIKKRQNPRPTCQQAFLTRTKFKFWGGEGNMFGVSRTLYQLEGIHFIV